MPRLSAGTVALVSTLPGVRCASGRLRAAVATLVQATLPRTNKHASDGTHGTALYNPPHSAWGLSAHRRHRARPSCEAARGDARNPPTTEQHAPIATASPIRVRLYRTRHRHSVARGRGHRAVLHAVCKPRVHRAAARLRTSLILSCPHTQRPAFTRTHPYTSAICFRARTHEHVHIHVRKSLQPCNAGC